MQLWNKIKFLKTWEKQIIIIEIIMEGCNNLVVIVKCMKIIKKLF